MGRARATRLLVPLTLVAALVAVLVIASSGGSYRVVAVFDQVNGLVRGAEVRAAGFEKVGTVDDISLGRDGLPHVRLTLDDGYRLRQGATANLRLYSLAGEVNRYVDLRQGSGPELRDGATLGLTSTDQPVEIDQVLSTLDPRTRAEVRGLLAELDAGTRGRGPDIRRALVHSADAIGQTAALLGDVRGDGDSLRALVRQGRRVVGTLAADSGAAPGAIDELAALLRTTARRQAELAAGVAGLPAGLRSPRLALERTDAAVQRLEGVVRDARPAVRALAPFSRDLRDTLPAARSTLAETRRLATAAPAQLRALRPLLRTASPVLDQLAPVLATANPMLDQIRVRLPDVFGFFSNWADFTANYDANGHAARIGLVFEPAPANQLGPSDSGAGMLLRPFGRTPGVLEGEPWKDYASSFVGGGAGR